MIHTFPSGLLGLLIINTFVLLVNALASSSGSNVQSLELIGYRPFPLSYIIKQSILNLIDGLVLTAFGDGLNGTYTSLPPAMRVIG